MGYFAYKKYHWLIEVMLDIEDRVTMLEEKQEILLEAVSKLKEDK